MKVLMIIDSLIKGGKERRLIELLNGFNENAQIQILLVLLKDTVDYSEVYNIPRVTVKILNRRIKKDPTVLVSLYRICKNFKPDIIHSWGATPSIYALPIAKLLGVKFLNAMITNAICNRGSINWIASKLTFPFSDKILSNSEAGLKAYNASVNNSCVIYNGFNESRARNILPANEIKNKFKINSNYVVGMVGIFNNKKDYPTFLLTAMKILEKRNDITFLAVGGGSNLGKSKELVPSLFKDRIIFLGNQDDVESIVNIFDIGVLTSNFDVAREGISNSIMEYMAFGKPVIATGGGGTNEIVLDKETGFIIKSGSIDQLEKSILYLIDNPSEVERMGQNGKNRVKDTFSIENMVESTIKLYHSLIE